MIDESDYAFVRGQRDAALARLAAVEALCDEGCGPEYVEGESYEADGFMDALAKVRAVARGEGDRG